jgi:hypothetical protein
MHRTQGHNISLIARHDVGGLPLYQTRWLFPGPKAVEEKNNLGASEFTIVRDLSPV